MVCRKEGCAYNNPITRTFAIELRICSRDDRCPTFGFVPLFCFRALRSARLWLGTFIANSTKLTHSTHLISWLLLGPPALSFGTCFKHGEEIIRSMIPSLQRACGLRKPSESISNQHLILLDVKVKKYPIISYPFSHLPTSYHQDPLCVLIIDW